MKEICVIAGITASGKTECAIRLAEAYNAEIISADSVAVYRELNIGSAKPTLEQQHRVRHHLINCRSIDEGYDVASFQSEARAAISEIQSRGKNVIVVGGTGLYLKALLYNYRFDEEEDIREIDESISTEMLYKELEAVDLESALKLHPNNRKRIVRALQAFTQHNKTQRERTDMSGNEIVIPHRMYFLTGPRDVMYERMNLRVSTMISNGLVEEVKALLDENDQLFSLQSVSAIGYREFKDYFLGNTSLETTIETIQKNTRRFAKRQWTWFKHQVNATWIDITSEDAFSVISKDM